MKKHLILLLFILFLVACGETKETQKPVEADGNETEVVGEHGDDETIDDEPVEEETTEEDGGILTEVGQKSNANGLTAELIAIKEINETIDLDPIKLTIDDIKVLRMSDIKDRSAKDFYSQYTDKDEFDSIQIMYTIENTVDKNIDFFFPISYLVLNTGEQIDASLNDVFMDSNNGGTFYGEVTKNTGISVILTDTVAEDIESIKLIFGRVWGEDGTTYQDETEITYDIN